VIEPSLSLLPAHPQSAEPVPAGFEAYVEHIKTNNSVFVDYTGAMLPW